MKEYIKSHLVHDKAALFSLISLSIPTILEEILSTLLQYVDTAMVGQLGEKATAAVSTTTTIGWLLHSIPSAVAVAMLACASKANGAREEKKLKRLAGQAILYAFVIGAVLEVAALLLAPYIPVCGDGYCNAGRNVFLYNQSYFGFQNLGACFFCHDPIY